MDREPTGCQNKGQFPMALQHMGHTNTTSEYMKLASARRPAGCGEKVRTRKKPGRDDE